MSDVADILAKLAAPFPPEVISWRVGSTTANKERGMALAYIDARDVQDRLDAVCGCMWQVRHPWSGGSKLACEIGIKIADEWIWRGDGAGDSDVEAEKGAFSDSFKRAAVRWGIGRYLYDMDSPWVALKPAGRSYAIADGEYARLRALLAGKSAPHATNGHAAPKAPAAAPARPAATTIDMESVAKEIKRELETADSLHKLDLVMDLHMADLKALPKVTYDYLGKVYEKRRDAMESVV
jgi:hypothetical protein